MDVFGCCGGVVLLLLMMLLVIVVGRLILFPSSSVLPSFHNENHTFNCNILGQIKRERDR